MADRLPAGVPDQAADAARDTLGSAVAVAGQLPPELGAAVLDTAREAFVQAMQLTSTIAAVVAVGLALLALLMLRGHGAPPAESGVFADAPPEQSAHYAPTRFEGATD